MTAFQRNDPRRVIPGWLSAREALEQGELSSLRQPPVERVIDDEELQRRHREWQATHKLSAAADLVGAATVFDSPEIAAEAADQLIQAGMAVPAGARRSAARLRFLLAASDAPARNHEADPEELPEVDAEEHLRRTRELIRDLRSAVRRDPRLALEWAELARQHEALGQGDAADRAMRVALAIDPDSRFIMRSAARLAVEHEDPDRGLRILQQSPRTKHDPWLVSAEIAIASVAERPSKLIKFGRQLVEANAFAPQDLAELASAVGTEELEGASSKRARRMFEKALERPTNNALAQAEWASRQIPQLDVRSHLDDTPAAWEARALTHAEEGDWKQALNNSWLWIGSQPFASSPGIFGSYQATLGGEHEQGAAIARAALIANPDTFMLRNNLAYCLLQDGHTEEASREIERMRRLVDSDDQHAFMSAIEGLLSFKVGAYERARVLYRQAQETTNDETLKAVAAITRAREEVRARTDQALPATIEALSIARPRVGTSDARLASLTLLMEQLAQAARENELQ